MASLTYTPLQLSRLSLAELNNIVNQRGLSSELLGAYRYDEITKEAVMTFIMQSQKGRDRTLLPQYFNLATVVGPINECVGDLMDYYDSKKNLIAKLSQLSDVSLFAVVDSLGHQLLLTTEYATVNGLVIKDQASLIWYLVGILSE